VRLLGPGRRARSIAPVDIQAARRSVESARRRLLRPTPEAVASCGEDLAAAIDCLRTLESLLASDRAGLELDTLAAEVAALRRGLAQVTALLAGASHFYRGWSALFAPPEEPVDASYAPARAAPATSGRGFVVHG